MFGFFKKPRTKKSYDLECVLCFKADALTTAGFVQLFERSDAPINPEQLEILGEAIPFTQQHRRQLLQMDAIRSRETLARGVKLLDAAGTESIHILCPAHPSKPQVIYWTFPREKVDVLEQPWLKSLLSRDDFVAGYCADREDMLLQSTTVYGLYQAKGIKPQKTTRNEFGDLIVDVTGNPGRRKLVRDMWLMSCWRMWFGRRFYDVVPKEKILTFSKAHALHEGDGVIHVTLYEDPFDAPLHVNRKIQQAFRDWIDMNSLEKRLT